MLIRKYKVSLEKKIPKKCLPKVHYSIFLFSLGKIASRWGFTQLGSFWYSLDQY